MTTSMPPSGNDRFRRSARVERQRLRSSSQTVSHSTTRSPQTRARSAAAQRMVRLGQRLDVKVQPSRFRLVLVWGILLLGMLGLLLNLFRLQVIEADSLQAQAQAQQMTYLRPFIPRRPIVDRAGNVLALDRPAYTLYAHPTLFKLSKKEVADKIANILDRNPADLVVKLNAAESGIRLEFDLSEDEANRLRSLGIDGLELEQHQQRFYPQQDLFAHVLGYVNLDRQAQAGVELSQEAVLDRTMQQLQLERSGANFVTSGMVPGSWVQQDDLELQLTLDSRLQRVAQDALRQQMQKYNAKRGTVLVMDAKTGEMRALVSEPSYDPNQFYNFEFDRFRDWAVSDLYEPGSTFKPINVAIALEAGVIRSNEVFPDEGRIEVGGWPIQNYDYSERGARGSQSVPEIIQHSSNVGMVHIVQRLNPDDYYNKLLEMGLGEPTGIDLPSEAAGQIKTREQFTGAAIEPATTAFGQGFSLTPIQLVQLQATLANQGQMLTPHVVRGLTYPDGRFYWKPDLPAPQRIFSPRTAQAVLSMMEGVVADGTGQVAKISGYRIGGKTGTAQKASPDGGYGDARITSFVSILPIDAPRYAIAVVIDEPQGEDAYGSTVAAPIAKTVMETLISLDQIAPTQPIEPPSEDPEV